MNIIARLLLFIFVSFLITPAVISVIEKDADTSAFYSFSEEEKTHKEIKAIINFDVTCTAVDLSQLNYSSIFTEKFSKHDNISSKIFIPPPEQV
ncbi:hypothetical protein FNW25_13375 [Flavobacterium franklandianum]|uniref:hypothetical protein n=1 Tax=Flavobacterium franklandianum TaxID=2594430 RepID=UPI00117A3997|nr:hypothetical protein [Flavobacterium franklandianum]TRX23387.1 hypothetical protein FNW25_13375 [Flavobacterium franklandianum]